MKTKLTNASIWPTPGAPARTVAALQQLLTKPVAVGLGLKLRRITRAIDQQITDLDAERVRIIELHVQRNGTGPVGEDKDPAGWAKASEEFGSLMALDFEVDAIHASELQNLMDLPGQTFVDLGDLLVDDLEDDGARVEAEMERKPKPKRRR